MMRDDSGMEAEGLLLLIENLSAKCLMRILIDKIIARVVHHHNGLKFINILQHIALEGISPSN
jgi:hypothetical protein